MDYDDIDVGILLYLSDYPESTTTDIVKALYIPPFNLSKLDSFIRYRMKRLKSQGAVKTNKKKVTKYSIDTNKVFFGYGILRMEGLDIDMGYLMLVKTDSETVAKSIDEYEKRIKKNFL